MDQEKPKTYLNNHHGGVNFCRTAGQYRIKAVLRSPSLKWESFSLTDAGEEGKNILLLIVWARKATPKRCYIL